MLSPVMSSGIQTSTQIKRASPRSSSNDSPYRLRNSNPNLIGLHASGLRDDWCSTPAKLIPKLGLPLAAGDIVRNVPTPPPFLQFDGTAASTRGQPGSTAR